MRQTRREESSEARPGSLKNEADASAAYEAEFSAAYKAEVVAWYVASGKTLADVAASLNLSESALRDWVWHTSLDDLPVQKPGPPSAAHAECEAKAAEAIRRAEAAEAAEAEACAVAVKAREETRAAYAAAVEAVVRAQIAAAEAVAQADAAASEQVARAEAAAAEAVATAQALAQSETVSRLEAEAAAREEVASTYASAMETVIRAEGLAVEALTQQAAPRAAAGRPEASEMVEERQVAQHGKPSRVPGPADGANDEAAARVQIAQLMSGLKPVELWVHTTGRTLEEATAAALEQLGVSQAQADIEVLSERSRWFPGRIQIRARVRVAETAR